jgi:hypothetical protein
VVNPNKRGERRTISPLPIAGCIVGSGAVAVLGWFVYAGLWLPAIFTILLIWFLFWLKRRS